MILAPESENVRISVQMHGGPVIVGRFGDKELGFAVSDTITAAAFVSTVNHLVLCLSQPEAK